MITQRLSTAMPCPAAAGNRAGRRRALRPFTHRTLSEKRFAQAVVTVIAAIISMLLFIISARRPVVNGLCAFIAPQKPSAGLSRRYSRPGIRLPMPRKPRRGFSKANTLFRTNIQRYLPVILFLLFFISCGVPLATIRPPAFPPPGPISII